jgi:glycosyltransferase involved in cell wall biosynthesis
VIDPADEEAFARALLELADDPARRREMGLAGWTHVQAHFSLARLVSDLDALYRRLLAEARPTRAA